MKPVARSTVGALAALLIGIAVGWSLPRASFPATPLSEPAPTTTASILLDFGDGRMTTYADIAVSDGQNVWQLMETLESSRGVAIEANDFGGDLGMLVTGIDGIHNDAASDRFWHYWVNQRFAQVGVSAHRVNPGDQVMWKYTSGQFRAETQ